MLVPFTTLKAWGPQKTDVGRQTDNQTDKLATVTLRLSKTGNS